MMSSICEIEKTNESPGEIENKNKSITKLTEDSKQVISRETISLLALINCSCWSRIRSLRPVTVEQNERERERVKTKKNQREIFVKMHVQLYNELRHDARILENDIDSKLLLLSKCSDANKLPSTTSKSSDKVPLLLDDSLSNDESSAPTSSADTFNRLSDEIETLLSRLKEVNDKMQSAMEGKSNNSISLTLDRHFAVYSDYRKEFNKTKAHFAEKYQRELLLSSSTSNGIAKQSNGEVSVTIPASLTDSSKVNTDSVLNREQESLRNSEILIDEQIDTALRTREALYNQKATLKAIHSQMTTLANRFPLINSVIQRINVRKKRDTAILAGLTGTCLFLLLIWSW